MKSRLFMAVLAVGALLLGGLVFGVVLANNRERQRDLERRERLERLGRTV